MICFNGLHDCERMPGRDADGKMPNLSTFYVVFGVEQKCSEKLKC